MWSQISTFCIFLIVSVQAEVDPAPNWQSFAVLDYPYSSCNQNDPHACWGLGVCGSNGKCKCNVGWRGPTCAQLDLAPAKKTSFGLPMNSSFPTWGGSGFMQDGKWQFLAGSKFLQDPSIYNVTGCPVCRAYSYINEQPTSNLPFWGSAPNPFSDWSRNPDFLADKASLTGSFDPKKPGKLPFGDDYHNVFPWAFTPFLNQNNPGQNVLENGQINVYQNNQHMDMYGKSTLALMESTGSDPTGPYTLKDPMWSLGAFRADFKLHPKTGSMLMLKISYVSGCGHNECMGMVIMESKSGRIEGPWTEHLVYNFDLEGHGVTHNKDQWDCDIKDPSFVIHPNGTTVIAYRAVCCHCYYPGTHTVDHTERVGLLYSDEWDKTPFTRTGVPLFEESEDLFMWIDDRGTHMVMHSQQTDHMVDHKKRRGALAFSADGLRRWDRSEWELFPAEIEWDDGHKTVLLKQQRPSLFFEPGTAKPIALTSGVDFLFDPCCDWYAFGSAWTLIQPIVQDCRAGYVLPPGGSNYLPAGSKLYDQPADCKECLETDCMYNGKCKKATTKYGYCVCAECTTGWAGDFCDQPAKECYDFVAKRECDQSQMTGPFKQPSDSGAIDMAVQDLTNETECLQACATYATNNNVQGCCGSFTGSSGYCQFYVGVVGAFAQNNAALKRATVCLDSASITTTTTTTTTTPRPNPPYNCTVTQSDCQAPYIDANGAMVYDTSCSTEHLVKKSHCDPVNPISVLNCNSEDCSDLDLCLSACEAKGQELDEEGCCYTFQGPRKTCQYHSRSSSVSNMSELRYSTLCYRMSTTNTPTTTTTTSTTSTTPATTTPQCTTM